MVTSFILLTIFKSVYDVYKTQQHFKFYNKRENVIIKVTSYITGLKFWGHFNVPYITSRSSIELEK